MPSGQVWSNWCKAAALLDAYGVYARARLLFWLDSDAVVWRFGRTLPAYLKDAHLLHVDRYVDRAGAAPTEAPTGKGHRAPRHAEGAHAPPPPPPPPPPRAATTARAVVCRRSARRALDAPQPAVWLFSNEPWGCTTGCTGTMVVRRTPSALPKGSARCATRWVSCRRQERS